MLAVRREEDEAFCAVCGDGYSVEPNVILFCDRCDVAVHQRCYDVHEVPSAEWLCWPCRVFEEQQRALGVPQSEIRPAHMMPEDRRRLTGGARDAKCLLCPIKCGAFRRTADGLHWVHQTCALWHPETYLLPDSGPDVVDGVARIATRRWTTPCDICGKADGAVINCKHPGTCQYAFHVLCARNCGLYLSEFGQFGLAFCSFLFFISFVEVYYRAGILLYSLYYNNKNSNANSSPSPSSPS